MTLGDRGEDDDGGDVGIIQKIGDVKKEFEDMMGECGANGQGRDDKNI